MFGGAKGIELARGKPDHAAGNNERRARHAALEDAGRGPDHGVSATDRGAGADHRPGQRHETAQRQERRRQRAEKIAEAPQRPGWLRRFCSEENSSSRPATAVTKTATVKSVGRSTANLDSGKSVVMSACTFAIAILGPFGAPRPCSYDHKASNSFASAFKIDGGERKVLAFDHAAETREYYAAGALRRVRFSLTARCGISPYKILARRSGDRTGGGRRGQPRRKGRLSRVAPLCQPLHKKCVALEPGARAEPGALNR